MNFISKEEKKKALSILQKMTLEEKCSLLEGKDYWNTQSLMRFDLPSIRMSDGPSGLRKQEGEADYLGRTDSLPTICYPAPVTCASTFDPQLLEQMGRCLGEECLEENVGILLTPGINLKRNPLNGRNFEYYSEDPYVSSQMATRLIQGLQSTGVGCSLKHFCCNNQEKGRMLNDSIVDDRALAELYLKSFRSVIENTSCATIMLAYNKLNGTYCCENKSLMALARKWGFTGAFISDWGAVSDPYQSFKNGLSLEMPGTEPKNAKNFKEKIIEASWSETDLDRRVLPILELMVHNKALFSKTYSFSKQKRIDIAKRIAQDGIVLLKNQDRILPLKSKKIALIGRLARFPHFQGAGSSHVCASEVEDLSSFLPSSTYAPGYDERGNTSEQLLKDARIIASNSDVAIVVVGLVEESEGEDRNDLDLPRGMVELIEQVAQVQSEMVVVVQAGAPIVMPWIESAKAILYTYLSGSYGGKAIQEILEGIVSPSGKLTETFVKDLDQIPAYIRKGSLRTTCYIESIYSGYRYYDAADVDVLFPFGYGLSYTSFSWKRFVVEGERIHFTIKNTGKWKGAEVAQLYVRSSNPFSVPKLLTFKKIFLDPGEEKRIELEYDRKDLLEYFGRWILRQGEYLFSLGSSSRNFVYTWKQEWVGEEVKVLPCYKEARSVPTLHLEDFAQLYGREWEENPIQRPFDQNATIADLMANDRILRGLIQFVIEHVLKKEIKEYQNLLEDLPLRILKMNGVSQSNLEALIEWINGHWIRGLKKIDWNEWIRIAKKVRKLE